MKAPAAPPNEWQKGQFRRRLLFAVMIVITALTAIGAWLAHRSVASDARRDLEQEFQSELSALHQLQTVRHEELVTLCRALVEKPRIHAALEDNALDLLYPSARDDLRELMSDGDAANSAGATSGRARFYRFLDGDGRVLPPSDSADAGAIEEVAAKQLTLSPLPETPQVGYINRGNDEPDAVDEVLAVPIFSTETGKIIAALAAGFRALEMHANTGGSLKSGILGSLGESGGWHESAAEQKASLEPGTHGGSSKVPGGAETHANR